MNLFKELKRRNVIRVGIAYLVISWFLAQVAVTLEDALNLPEWFDTMVVTLLMLGFPFTLFFSWAFEITTDGIKRERDIVRDDSIAHITAKKLDLITLVAVAGVALLVLWQHNQPTKIIQTSNTAASSLEKTTTENFGNTQKTGTLQNSIAVLPFVNRSNNKNDLYFSEGIHDDILTNLAKIKALKVISRTSVNQYKETTKSIKTIGKELGVSVVLEGGIQRAGNRIRVNAQLIDVKTDQHLWAELYDNEMTIKNLFDIQTKITKHIVTAIKGEMTVQEITQIEYNSTDSLLAWELLSQAKSILRNSGYNAIKYETALSLAKQATVQDPQFVVAWALLANIHSSLYWSGSDPTPGRQSKALEALNKAISLDAKSTDVLAAQGEYYYRIELNYPKALKYQQQALIYSPGDAEILASIGITQRRLGLWNKSLANLTKASQLDPGNENSLSAVIETLDMLGKADTLQPMLTDALKRFPDSSDIGAMAVDFQIWAFGDIEKAKQIYQTIKPVAGDAYVGITQSLYWYQRDYQSVLQSFEQEEVIDFYSLYPGSLDLAKAEAYQFLNNKEQMKAHLLNSIDILTPLDYQRNIFNVAVDISTLATAKALIGQKEQAIALINELDQLFPLERDVVDGAYFHIVACYVLALSGEEDRALDKIEKLLNTPGGLKRWNLYLDPRWDFFRDNERFKQLSTPTNLDQSHSSI
ncbi:MAG: tetratricopeptide repeat protein [bacterium]